MRGAGTISRPLFFAMVPASKVTTAEPFPSGRNHLHRQLDRKKTKIAMNKLNSAPKQGARRGRRSCREVAAITIGTNPMTRTHILMPCFDNHIQHQPLSTMKAFFSIIFAVALSIGGVEGQTLLTETTWGGVGSDVAEGVASAADGSSYVVGITDSFTTDQFGNPSAKIFVVKFAPDGSLSWQRIWNRTTIRGLGRPDVAVSADGSVYVTGITADNGNDAVLLKFDANGTLLWERDWGGAASDEGLAVATASDGSVYLAGAATSFGPSSSGLFVVKFDSAGNLVWQRISDGAAGNAVAVASDGSVYAAGTIPRADQIGNFDIVVLKITAAGSLVWQRTYSAGEVVDPRGRMATGSDGSIVIAGAIQAASRRFVDIAALIVKLTSDGALVFDKQFAGRASETGDGVAVAPDNTIYVAGTTTSFGAGNQDVFVLHLQPTGKKLLDAFTWGGPGFETGAGIAVNGGTLMLAATTTTAPPYSLLAASAKLSGPRGTLAVVEGVLADVPGVVANPGAGATAPTGSTIFSGNFEAALVRVAR